jgi:hypothetical protein
MRKGFSMKQVLNILLLSAVAAGCAKSQNPVKNYEGVKAITPYEQVLHDQKFATCLVEIDTAPTLVVSQGETSSQKIYVRGFANPAKQNLVLEGAPEGLHITPGEVTSKGKEFTLSMTGSDSLISNGQDFATFEVSIVPPTANAGIDCSEKVGVVVTRSKQTPVIKKISAPTSIDLANNQDRSVTVDVSAPGLKDKINLLVIRRFDTSASSKENPVFDLSPAIQQIGDAEPTGNSNFRIKLEVNSEIAKLLLKQSVPADFKKPEVEMLFTVTVINKETNKPSPEQNVVIRLKREEDKK